MRTPLVVGNWKMHLTRAAGRDIAQKVRDQAPAGVRVGICPPSVYILALAELMAGSEIQVGAQDCYLEAQGAFTGETSAVMLRDVGAQLVIIGHSERRHTIGHLEDDWMVNRKIRAARAAGLRPIVCVGETLAQRKAGQTGTVLTFQLTAALVDNPVNSSDDLVIAYEPVWAIGTGQVATPDQAQEAHQHLRQVLLNACGPIAQEIPILYGGSVKPDNAEAIMAQPDVDGALVGGASLKSEEFLGIIRATLAAKGVSH